jgi:anti-sigma28 factor (negative regulator of flagellin synthesis)
MEVQGPGGVAGPNRIELHRVQPAKPADAEVAGRVGDRAEISDQARLLNKLAEVPEMRLDRIQELRELIAAGRYETAERIEKTVEKLLEEI